MKPDNYWEASGIPVPAAPPLTRDIRVEVAVIGAGYCGLNAGLELAARGIDAVVIEAQPLGKGASGRSGGFAGSRFRMPPATVLKRHGAEMVALLERISAEAVSQVERNVAELEIPEARLTRHGSIRAAVNENHFVRLKAGLTGAVAGDFGRTPEIRVLDREEIAALTGSPRFVGGTLDTRAQGLHPYNYTMGLARALVARGMAIHAETPVTGVRVEGDGVRLDTTGGTIRAGQVIMATNGYSRLTRATAPLAEGIIPFRSAAIATAPLPADLAPRVLPEGRMMVDTKRILRWFRLVDGRVIIGGRGAGKPSQDDAAYEAMHRNLLDVFPQLASVPIEHRWSGFVGMTLDSLPHIGRASERVILAGGFNGNGVAMASLFGRYAARIALGEPPETGILDAAWFRRIPLYRLSAPGVRLATRYLHVLDALGV